MHTLLQPIFIVLLFALVCSADRAISAGVARDYIRAICYGIVAILALVVVTMALLGA